MKKRSISNQYFIYLTAIVLSCFYTLPLRSQPGNLPVNQADTLVSQEILYTYPTPDELLDVIEKENLDFNHEYLNPVENVPQYISLKTRNLNLGVYLADLAYAAFFSKRNKITQYVDAVSQSSHDLLISSETKTKMKEDLIRNMENLDSIYHLTNIYYYEIMQELENNNSNSLMIIVSAGTYIESIYLSLSLVDNFTEKEALVQKIAEQKNAFISLLNTCKLYEEDYYVKEVIPYLEKITGVYNQFKVEDQGKLIFIKKADGTVRFRSAEKVTMTEQQLITFRNTIREIRNEITLN
ncbi:MAG: hypothetical protein V2I54_05395 [Bacteroidales bacterium]|jgi:hypothetical protein|nr:hypothetical protein [Bacteroidales bacterium]